MKLLPKIAKSNMDKRTAVAEIYFKQFLHNFNSGMNADEAVRSSIIAVNNFCVQNRITF